MLSRFEEFTYNINEASLYWHRIAGSEMKKYGLKGSSAIYFVKLNRYPEGIPAAMLGKMCGKDKADVSREIAKLEKLGFVKRMTSEKSGYRVPIVLTEQGKGLAETITNKAALAMDYVGNALTEEESVVFRKAFEKIVTNLKVLSEAGIEES